MVERLDGPARAALSTAQHEARALGHRWLGTEHLLLGLLDTETVGSNILAPAGVDREAVRSAINRMTGSRHGPGPEDADLLQVIGIDLDQVRRRIEESFGAGALDRATGRESPGNRWGRLGGPGFTRRARKVIEVSLREAIASGHRQIHAEHLLLGLVREGNGLAMQVLASLGVSPGLLRDAAREQLARDAGRGEGQGEAAAR